MSELFYVQIIFLLVLLLFISIIISINLWYKNKTILKKPKKQSIELKEFLSDLLVGESLISVQRIDASDLFTISPKGK